MDSIYGPHRINIIGPPASKELIAYAKAKYFLFRILSEQGNLELMGKRIDAPGGGYIEFSHDEDAMGTIRIVRPELPGPIARHVKAKELEERQFRVKGRRPKVKIKQKEKEQPYGALFSQPLMALRVYKKDYDWLVPYGWLFYQLPEDSEQIEPTPIALIRCNADLCWGVGDGVETNGLTFGGNMFFDPSIFGGWYNLTGKRYVYEYRGPVPEMEVLDTDHTTAFRLIGNLPYGQGWELYHLNSRREYQMSGQRFDATAWAQEGWQNQLGPFHEDFDVYEWEAASYNLTSDIRFSQSGRCVINGREFYVPHLRWDQPVYPDFPVFSHTNTTSYTGYTPNPGPYCESYSVQIGLYWNPCTKDMPYPGLTWAYPSGGLDQDNPGRYSFYIANHYNHPYSLLNSKPLKTFENGLDEDTVTYLVEPYKSYEDEVPFDMRELLPKFSLVGADIKFNKYMLARWDGSVSTCAQYPSGFFSPGVPVEYLDVPMMKTWIYSKLYKSTRYWVGAMYAPFARLEMFDGTGKNSVSYGTAYLRSNPRSVIHSGIQTFPPVTVGSWIEDDEIPISTGNHYLNDNNGTGLCPSAEEWAAQLAGEYWVFLNPATGTYCRRVTIDDPDLYQCPDPCIGNYRTEPPLDLQYGANNIEDFYDDGWVDGNGDPFEHLSQHFYAPIQNSFDSELYTRGEIDFFFLDVGSGLKDLSGTGKSYRTIETEVEVTEEEF